MKPHTDMEPRTSAADVLAATLIVGGVNLSEFAGPGRDATLVTLREAYAWVAHETFGHSYPDVARAMHRRTHSAVHEARWRADNRRRSPDGQRFIELCQTIEAKARQISSSDYYRQRLGGSPAAIDRLVQTVNAANPLGCTAPPASVADLARAVRSHTHAVNGGTGVALHTEAPVVPQRAPDRG